MILSKNNKAHIQSNTVLQYKHTNDLLMLPHMVYLWAPNLYGQCDFCELHRNETFYHKIYLYIVQDLTLKSQNIYKLQKLQFGNSELFTYVVYQLVYQYCNTIWCSISQPLSQHYCAGIGQDARILQSVKCDLILSGYWEFLLFVC